MISIFFALHSTLQNPIFAAPGSNSAISHQCLELETLVQVTLDVKFSIVPISMLVVLSKVGVRTTEFRVPTGERYIEQIQAKYVWVWMKSS